MSSKSTAQGYPVSPELLPSCDRFFDATPAVWVHLGKKPGPAAVEPDVSLTPYLARGTVAVPEEEMEKAISDFKDQHALLLTEIRRLSEEEADDAESARTRELRSILKVVFRSYLRESVDPGITEEQLTDWLGRLEAA
jgi:hypothetical protein